MLAAGQQIRACCLHVAFWFSCPPAEHSVRPLHRGAPPPSTQHRSCCSFTVLQRGIDLTSLDVSYFTSLSYYILLLFGARGVFSLVFRCALHIPSSAADWSLRLSSVQSITSGDAFTDGGIPIVLAVNP